VFGHWFVLLILSFVGRGCPSGEGTPLLTP
jgi:hypothetical protein